MGLNLGTLGNAQQKQDSNARGQKSKGPEPNVPLVVFIGDHMSGTTSIIRRYIYGMFYNLRISEPLRIVRHTKNVVHPKYNWYVTVQFCDIEGGDINAALQMALHAHAVVVVYDVTNRTTFEKAQEYLESINPRLSVMLLGNKVETDENRRVSKKEGKLLARIHRVAFMEVSASNNYNIEESLNHLICCIPDEYFFSKSRLQKLRTNQDRDQQYFLNRLPFVNDYG